MDPKYLKEYLSEKHFVLYEVGAYTVCVGTWWYFERGAECLLVHKKAQKSSNGFC
jgi:hypothetical protein